MRAVAAIVLALLVLSLAFVWVSDPAHPHELDLWGHQFTADGNGLVFETSQDPPWPNEPISLAEVLRRDPKPVIVHQTSGPFLNGAYRRVDSETVHRPEGERHLLAGRLGRVHPLLLGSLLRADMVS